MKKLTIFFLLILSSISYAQDFDKLANAVVDKDLNTLDSLLQTGIDVNITEEDRGATVLLIASSFKDYEDVVSFLISRGADINFRGKDGRTPLIWAAGNSLESSKMLLENGADVNSALISKNAAGWTALHFAAINGDTELVEYLILQGGRR